MKWLVLNMQVGKATMPMTGFDVELDCQLRLFRPQPVTPLLNLLPCVVSAKKL